jgi:hypothetical protein
MMASRLYGRLAALAVLACVAVPMLSACGKGDEKPPAGYYDGPRTPKGVANDTNPAPTNSSSSNTGGVNN